MHWSECLRSKHNCICKFFEFAAILFLIHFTFGSRNSDVGNGMWIIIILYVFNSSFKMSSVLLFQCTFAVCFIPIIVFCFIM